MRSIALVAVLAALLGAAHADSSTPPTGGGKVKKPPATGRGDWCWDLYFATPGEAIKIEKRPPAVQPDQGWIPAASDPSSPPVLRVRIPVGYDHRARGPILQISPTPAEIEETIESMARSFAPLLQVRAIPAAPPGHAAGSDVKAELEETIRVVVEHSGSLFPSRAQTATRPARIDGQVATEFCAILDRSPGHMTVPDGTHLPLPYERELLHGFVIALGHDARVAAFYRVPHKGLDVEPTFAAILETLTLR